MTLDEIVIAIIGLAIAGLVKGATGIGFSTTGLPIIALSIGLDRAMPLVLLPSISSNLSVMLSAGEFRVMLSNYRWLYVALLPGLICGLFLLTRIDTHNAARVLGAIIIAYVAYALIRPGLSVPKTYERWLNAPTGFVNGLLNGLTGSQILPVVPYALSLGLTPDGIIQITNIAFTLSSLVMIVGLNRIGFLDGATFLLSAAGVVPGLIGVAAGTRLRKRIQPQAFRKAVLVVLMGMAALLIIGR
jgi:uncharacterized membrane protein YfcA